MTKTREPSVKFNIPETQDFSKRPLNRFIKIFGKRGVFAVTLFKHPYDSSGLTSRFSNTVGMMHVLDLLCCEIPVGYAFMAPASIQTHVSAGLLNIYEKSRPNVKSVEPKLTFRGSNFNLYVDTLSERITLIIDRANLVDVSNAN